MFHRFTKKKMVAAAVGVAALLASAGGAFAYFTTTGSGSGNATVGTNSALLIHGGTPVGGAGNGTLYPGTSVTVPLTVDNPSKGAQRIGNVTLAGVKACTLTTWDPTLNSNAGGCPSPGVHVTGCESFTATGADTTANFSMADVPVNQVLAGSATGVSASYGFLAMNNLASPQDACRSVNLYLTFTNN